MRKVDPRDRGTDDEAMTDQQERTPRQLMVSQDYIDGIHSVHNAAAVQLRSRIVKLEAERDGMYDVAAKRTAQLDEARRRIEHLEAALRAFADPENWQMFEDEMGGEVGPVYNGPGLTDCTVAEVVAFARRALDPTEVPR